MAENLDERIVIHFGNGLRQVFDERAGIEFPQAICEEFENSVTKNQFLDIGESAYCSQILDTTVLHITTSSLKPVLVQWDDFSLRHVAWECLDDSLLYLIRYTIFQELYVK